MKTLLLTTLFALPLFITACEHVPTPEEKAEWARLEAERDARLKKEKEEEQKLLAQMTPVQRAQYMQKKKELELEEAKLIQMDKMKREMEWNNELSNPHSLYNTADPFTRAFLLPFNHQY